MASQPQSVASPDASPTGPSDDRGKSPVSVLAEILRFNEGRKPSLLRRKLKRMAEDSFAFFRGTDHLFADAWRDLRPPDEGPSFPICGDLHLENFGAYRDDAGELLYDINDFDEAVVAPCSLDLVRCASSILLASELWRLTPLEASGRVLTFLDAYRATVVGRDLRHLLDGRLAKPARGPIWEVLGKCAEADHAELLARHTTRTGRGKRKIVRDKIRNRAIKADRAAEVTAALEAYGAASGRAGTLAVLDVAGRIAGIGSLGVPRFTILVAGGGDHKTNRLFDLKSCLPSSLGALAARPWPYPDESDAARVVRAQRMLQGRPAAGLDVVMVGAEAFRLRELIPEENRSSLSRFDRKPGKLRIAIEAAGQLTALSHHRGAAASPEGGGIEALEQWASGPALDSVLVGAARFAEHTRVAYRQYRDELRSAPGLPTRPKESP